MAETRAPINPWLKERLGLHNSPQPTLVNVIVEVDPAQLEAVQSELGRLGIRINTARISFGRYIPAAVPPELLEMVAAIPGVLKIDKNMPVTVRLMNPLQDLMGAVFSPVARVIPTLPAPTFTDEILGQVRMSQVEIPGMPALGPAGILFGLLPPKRPDINIIPTGVVRESLKVPEDNMIGLVVGLIDTGITPTHPQFNLNVRIEGLSVTGEPFLDGQGHGMWVSTAAFGGPFQTPFGMCRGIASPDAGRGGKIVHVKALSNLGAGTTDGIMKAIEMCLERGCKVISMSLGSELQGGVDQDPLCRLITQYQNSAVFVVAAANSGPDPWTIGSPAASPGALCVGAMSLMDYAVSWFSSRGPNGAWYRDHPDDWTCDLQRYGEALIKPDIVMPGGGRALKEATPDEVLYSGVSGWFDGFYDMVPNLFEGMHGTSQSAPLAAGLIALALDRGTLPAGQGAAAVRAIMSRLQVKNPESGYGVMSAVQLGLA